MLHPAEHCTARDVYMHAPCVQVPTGSKVVAVLAPVHCVEGGLPQVSATPAQVPLPSHRSSRVQPSRSSQAVPASAGGYLHAPL